MGNRPEVGKTGDLRTKRAILAGISILVASTMILSVLWLRNDENEWFSLSQVEGGVKCTVSDGHPYGVKVDNGVVNVYWHIEDAQSPTGSWTATPLEIQSLGGISLRLTLIDLEGDGQMTHGDYIVVTAVNSTHFPTDVTHNFTLMYGALAVSGWDVRTSFWFEDGGLTIGETRVIIMPI